MLINRIKYAGIASAILGVVFKLLHLMGAETLLLIGGVVLAGVYLYKAVAPSRD